jgi:hypothetical protein
MQENKRACGCLLLLLHTSPTNPSSSQWTVYCARVRPIRLRSLFFAPQAIVKPPEEKWEFASDKQTQFLVSDTPSGTSSGAMFGKDVNRKTLSNRENTVNISQVAEPDPTY